jgi:hypothetical protein
MASAVILMIGITALLSATTSVMRLKDRNRSSTTALHAAETVIEEVLLRSQSDPLLVVGGPYSGPSFNAEMQRTAGGRFSTSWVVSVELVSGIRKVAVTTTWTEGGVPHSITLETHRR